MFNVFKISCCAFSSVIQRLFDVDGCGVLISHLAVTNYHKFRGLKQHKCIILQFCGIQSASYWPEVEVLAGLYSSGGSRRAPSSLCTCWRLNALISPSLFKASTVGLVLSTLHPASSPGLSRMISPSRGHLIRNLIPPATVLLLRNEYVILHIHGCRDRAEDV